jgi:serine/threonine protein kinase/tetratricopeptide (TPR) repeat protein
MTIAAGTSLGRYEIHSQLGAGGMGEVYLAEDTKLDRKVALKILPAEVAANQERMRRFVREAKAVSALNHPNIVTIHEIDETNSIHFIVIEFIDGETLRRHKKGARLSVPEALDVGIQVASALSAAHKAGIIHRDIKPENIMIRRDGIVKVLDFGLAKLTEHQPATQVDTEAATKALIKTEPGVVVGTAQYMSPEQVRGLALDARTDIFSIGVVLYEMVAGRRPFEGATISDMIVSILERQPPTLATYRRLIPDTLEWIVSKALRKDREERYQTAKDLAIDLRGLKQSLEIDAELERSKHPGIDGGTASADKVGRVAAETVKGPAQISDLSRTETPVRKRRSRQAIDSLAILPLVNGSGDPNAEYLSDGITESIINSLSQIPKLRVMARSTVFRYKGREVDPQTVGRELGVRAVLTGRVLQLADYIVIGTELVDAADGSQLWGEQYRRSVLDIFAVQEAISREISGKLRLKLTGAEKKRLTKRYTENTEAYHLYLKGRYYENKFFNEAALRRAIECFQQAIERDPTYALAYAGLADCYIRLSIFNVAPSKEGFAKARAAVLKALEIDDKLAEAHTSLARIKSSFDWDWLAAEEEFRRAIELNPNYATAHHLYGRHLMIMGRFDEAAVEIRRASELDPLSLHINADLSAPLFFARQYDRAIESLRETLEMDPNFALAHVRLGGAYEFKGMYEEAIAEYQRAIELSGSSADNPTMSAVLAHSYAASGRGDQARDILNRLKEQSQRGYVSPCDIAEVHAALGEEDQAFEWLEKAYDARSSDLRFLKVSQFFTDSLRSDPRFADLLRRVGLAEIS